LPECKTKCIKAPMIFIENTEDLSAFCQKLAEKPFIAVDTEFIRERSFYPKLCLIQVAAEGIEGIIDPKAKGINLEPFFDLLQNESVMKVFHACSQDIEIFFLLTGSIPKPLFDTQIAAMVCSMGDSVSYLTLCEKVLGVTVDKEQRFTDWSARPLSEKQLGYALNDVTYLRDAYPKIVAMLEEQGRTSWVSEEMAALSDPAAYEDDPESAWKRIKFHSSNCKSLSVLKEIAAWREREAIYSDKPRQWILKDEHLAEIANLQPLTIPELSRMRLLPPGFARSRLAVSLLEAVQKGQNLSAKDRPEKPKSKGVSKSKKALVSVLSLLLNVKSHEFGVAAHLIASADELIAIAEEEHPKVRAMEGWRYDIFGADALLLKQGKLKIFYDASLGEIGFERLS